MMPLPSTPASALARLQSRPAFGKAGRMSLARASLLSVVEMVFEPLIVVASLWAVAAAIDGRLRPQYMILALVVFALTFPNEARLPHPRGRAIVDIVTGWLMTSRREYGVLGRLEQLPQLVKGQRIDVVYLALPMVSTPRLRALLDALRDTTASVYFAPDPFVTDLIQGSVDSVSGMPVLGVCDSPFSGASGLLKRASDIVLSLLILVLIAPLFAAIALAVKLGSSGPVIFRQRRYGLDGEEIVVYKFRSMRVIEDGDAIRQCTRDDERVTWVGAFLRRTSLDELPQFINVLQGRMSIVGPRPHAVAHNELYRKLIKGYMQRHKVKPGITGWAQVNGLRGETTTLERMQARVEHDLDYLRNWSLGLDLYIMVKTVWVVLRGENAH